MYKNHQNSGIMPVIYSYAGASSRKLKAIMAIPEGNNKKVGRLIKYYSEILHDPVALAKYRDDAERGHERQLQGDIIKMQTVTVDGCLFEDNDQGPDSVLTIDGLIYVAGPSNQLTVKNSIFRRNSFTSPVNGVRLSRLDFCSFSPVYCFVLLLTSFLLMN
jgi:hypothetical protein